MKYEKLIRNEIERFGEYKFNEPYKIYKTYEALFSVLKTVADVNGNLNGKAENWEINNYYEKFQEKPLIKVIKEMSPFFY